MNNTRSHNHLPVSVAIATYNGEKYLEEQLDSILSQSLRPVELIICDDQSTDGTAAILEKYQQKGLLRYYVNKDRLGFVGNFKRAVSMTLDTNYVALSDQDDIWLPGKLQAAAGAMMKLEEGNKPSMVYSDLVLVDENKNLLNKSFRNELGQDVYKHCLETLLFGGFVNGCTMLMNPAMRNYFQTIPDNSAVDHDTWITLIAYTFGQVGVVPDSLIQYRKHSNNASEVNDFRKKSRFQRLSTEVIRAFKKNDLFEDELSCVEQFYNTFHQEHSDDQKRLIKRFLKLKGRSYIEKKIALWVFFKGKWI